MPGATGAEEPESSVRTGAPLTAQLCAELSEMLRDPPVIVRVPDGFEDAFEARRRLDTQRNVRVGGPAAFALIVVIAGAFRLFRSEDIPPAQETIFQRIVLFELAVVAIATLVLRGERIFRYYKPVMATAGAAAAAATTVGAAILEDPRMAQCSAYSTMLVITVVTVSFRHGFRTSLLTVVAGAIAAFTAATRLGAHPDWLMIAYAFGGSSLVGLVLAWILERQQVLHFYQSLLLRYEADERTRLNEKLESMSRTDSLSGLPNRRSFDDALDLEWARMNSERSSLALIFVDVDHFKRFNDTYGHREGDACLRAVGQAIARCVHRPADLAARYGGEEFVLLLPATDGNGAMALAERVLAAVDELAIPHGDSPTADHVTISLGVSVADGGSRLEARHLVDTADAALYRAKREGRHRICMEALRADSLLPVGNRGADVGGKRA